MSPRLEAVDAARATMLRATLALWIVRQTARAPDDPARQDAEQAAHAARRACHEAVEALWRPWLLARQQGQAPDTTDDHR